MMRLVCSVVVLFALIQPAAARNWADEPDYADSQKFARSRALCGQLRAVALPAADRGDRRKSGGMDGCRSQDLYYGIGRPADPAAAFRCAQLEGADFTLAGDMMLATLHANGHGAPRDLDKAIALVCRTQAAPYEIDGAVQALDAARQSGKTEPAFDWCDHATSGYLTGWCADRFDRLADSRRMAEFDAFRQRWPDGEAAGRLSALVKAAEAFKAVREAEIDQSGTMRGVLVVAAEAEIKDLLVKDLQALAQGDPRLAQAAADSAADAHLNQVYKRVMAHPFHSMAGAPTPDGIRKVQRAWLKYRDAWVAFAKEAAPGLPAQAVVNWQTRHRVAQLQDIIGER